MVILTHICVPSIRVHLEIFGAALVTRFPALVLPRILRELESFNHVYQVLSSYFIILGHYVMNIIQSKTALNPSIVVEIINILIPWCSLTRTYLLTHSCLLTYSLITYSLTFTHSPFTHSLTHPLTLPHSPLPHSLLLTPLLRLSCASGISRSTAQMVVIELIPYLSEDVVLTHSLTHSPTHSLTHSLTHSGGIVAYVNNFLTKTKSFYNGK